jgi:hypothetical protein
MVCAEAHTGAQDTVAAQVRTRISRQYDRLVIAHRSAQLSKASTIALPARLVQCAHHLFSIVASMTEFFLRMTYSDFQSVGSCAGIRNQTTGQKLTEGGLDMERYRLSEVPRSSWQGSFVR